MEITDLTPAERRVREAFPLGKGSISGRATTTSRRHRSGGEVAVPGV
ncbi:hypothetical protein ACIBJF_12110 [Streptomyces sp. NPDC050743]